ncbi:MAG TPA: hypothetical protein VF092_12055, partial [Longimicrobium sp.]
MSMELKEDFVFEPLPRDTTEKAGLRAKVVQEPTLQQLGPIAGLLGDWGGSGFNTIWRPFHAPPGAPPQDHFLELNQTSETLQIHKVKGEIPNRGLLQDDIILFGVHYLQQIQDAVMNSGLHFEPGIWLNIPP